MISPSRVPKRATPCVTRRYCPRTCTGWHAAVSAGVGPGKTVAVVGDGAVGLCAVLAAKQLGADTIISMSRHEARQRVATAFGATHIVEERDDDGSARIKELTEGIGADCVLECVGTESARLQAVGSVRDGGNIGLVGVPHGDLPVDQLFWRNVGLKGGPADCRAYLPHLMDLVWTRQIDPVSSSTWNFVCQMSPKPTPPWTSVARSSHCSARSGRADIGRRIGASIDEHLGYTHILGESRRREHATPGALITKSDCTSVSSPHTSPMTWPN